MADLPLPPAGEGRGEGGVARPNSIFTAVSGLVDHPHPALSRQRERVLNDRVAICDHLAQREREAPCAGAYSNL